VQVLFVHLLTCIQTDSEYIIIKQYVDQDLQDKLFEHTRMMREMREMKDRRLTKERKMKDVIKELLASDSETKPPCDSGELRDLLKEAIESGRQKEVSVLLNRGPGLSIDTTFDDEDEDGGKQQSALYLAARYGHSVLVEWFLQAQKANPKVKNMDGWTALHISAKNGHYSTVQLLLAAGADIHATNNEKETAPYIAAWWGNGDILQLLMRHGGDITHKNIDGWNALHIAAKNEHPSIVQMYLDAGADIHATTNEKETALYIAAWFNCKDVLQLLLHHDRDITHKSVDGWNAHKNEDGWNAVHIATRNGNLSIVHLLLDAGADINETTTTDQMTPLFIAADWNLEEMVQMLIGRGADIMIKNKDGESPLYAAVSCGHLAATKALLSSMDQASIISKRNNGETALYRAAKDSKEEIVLLILGTKAYLPARHEIGVTSVANQDEIEAVHQVLMDRIGQTEARAEDEEQKILHWAVLNGDHQLVEKFGVDDFKSWTKGGANLWHVAASNGQEAVGSGQREILDSLRTAEIDIMPESENGPPVLHLAAGSGNDTVMRALLGSEKSKESDGWVYTTTKETKEKETALYLAVKKKHRTVEELLWKEMNRVDFTTDPEAAEKAFV
jgi:ankyrin repeat protein